MSIAVLSCSGARIFVRYGRLNAIFAKIALARSYADSVINPLLDKSKQDDENYLASITLQQ